MRRRGAHLPGRHARDVSRRRQYRRDLCRGSLVRIGGATVSTGGPVSNTGFPLRRMGNSVKLMGKCGQDMFGSALIEAIRAEAPAPSWACTWSPARRPATPSWSARLASTACSCIAPAQQPWRRGHRPRRRPRRPPDALRLSASWREPTPTAARGTDRDVRRRTESRRDDQPRHGLPRPRQPRGRVDWADLLGKVLPDVDIFTPNIEELTLMLRRETFDTLTARAGQSDLLGVMDGELDAQPRGAVHPGRRGHRADQVRLPGHLRPNRRGRPVGPAGAGEGRRRGQLGRPRTVRTELPGRQGRLRNRRRASARSPAS